MNATSERQSAPEKIRLTLEKGGQFPSAALFGRGVRLHLETGVDIRNLLCRQLGVADSYLDDRIQTVFLNGRAVDDVDESRVEDGDVLSLSAAMPGLVGATFRRGGHLAALRQNITYVGSEKKDAAKAGTVTLKLFNLVARELGPHLLSVGVIISGKELAAPLTAAEQSLAKLERNGGPVSMAQLSDLLDSDRDVFFQVETYS